MIVFLFWLGLDDVENCLEGFSSLLEVNEIEFKLSLLLFELVLLFVLLVNLSLLGCG
jgi:hypothetical protein